MRAVLLKELRENAKWSGAIFVVILMVVYGLMRRRNPYMMYALAEPPMLMFVPLVGLLFGVVQSLFETKADNWAFVVHRPASRRQIFVAKSVAGLVLLYGALGLPCLIAAAWAARPGNLRITFAWPMLLPSLALVLSSGCYYFVGMIVTLRGARWWGTRLLPVAFAISCSLGILVATEFWQAAIVVMVCCLIGATAAYETFATAGAADSGFVGRLALGTTLSIGSVSLGIGVVAFSIIFQSTRSWSWWRLDNDGNVLRVTTTLHGNERTSEVSDPSGRRIPELSGVDLDDPFFANRFVRFETTLLDERLIEWPISVIYYGNGYRYPAGTVVGLPRAGKFGVRMPYACQFNMSNRIIEVYDSGSRRLFGTVGPGGFSPGRTVPKEQFPGTLLNPDSQRNTHTLAFNSSVYWMELDRRRVRKIYSATTEDPVVAATELAPQSDPTVLIGTRKHLYVLRPSGEVISTATLNPNLNDSFCSVAMLPNRHVVSWTGPMSPTEPRHPAVVELTTDPIAQVVKRTETPKYQSFESLTLPRTVALALVYPPAAVPVFRYWQWSWLLELGPQRGRLFQWSALASGVLSCVLAILLARRYGNRYWGVAGWALIALALGPAGIVALVGLNEMPAREGCAVCGGSRWAGRLLCPRCAADLEPPAAEGLEIFEPENSAAAFV
jgi:hypothetical protein